MEEQLDFNPEGFVLIRNNGWGLTGGVEAV